MSSGFSVLFHGTHTSEFWPFVALHFGTIMPGRCKTSVLRTWPVRAVCGPTMTGRECRAYHKLTLRCGYTLCLRWMKIPLSLAEPGESIAGVLFDFRKTLLAQ